MWRKKEKRFFILLQDESVRSSKSYKWNLHNPELYSSKHLSRKKFCKHKKNLQSYSINQDNFGPWKNPALVNLIRLTLEKAAFCFLLLISYCLTFVKQKSQMIVAWKDYIFLATIMQPGINLLNCKGGH